MQIWADYGYWLEVRKVRQRSLKPIHLRGVTPVEIAEVSAFDDPSALQETYERSVKPFQVSRWHKVEPKARVKTVERPGGRTIGPGSVAGKERVTDTRPGHDGRLWRPLMSDDFKTPMRVEHLAAFGANYSKSHPFTMRGRRDDDRPWEQRGEYFELDGYPTRDQLMDLNVRETGKDGEEAAILRVNEAARNLLVHDGALWTVQKEPVYVVGMESGKIVFELERPSSVSKVSGVAFPVTARDEAREFAVRLAERHGARKPSDPYKDAVVSDARYLTRDLDVTSAFLAAQAMFRLVRCSSLRVSQYENPLVATLLGTRGHYASRFEYRSLKEIGDPLAFARDLEQVVFDGPHREKERKLADVIQPLELARELGVLKEPETVWDEDLEALSSFMAEEAASGGPSF